MYQYLIRPPASSSRGLYPNMYDDGMMDDGTYLNIALVSDSSDNQPFQQT
jgi:hypothetical protein